MRYSALVLVVFATIWSDVLAGRHHPVTSLCGMDQLRSEIMEKINDLWTETGHPEWQYLARKKGGMDAQLVVEFTNISEKLDSFRLVEPSENVLTSIWVWTVLSIEMDNINHFWTTFRKTQVRPDPLVYADSWKLMANEVLHDSPDRLSLLNSISSLQDMIWDKQDGHRDVFKIVQEETEDQMCESEMSPQQLIYNLYVILQMSQLKAYTMIQFSWLLLRVYNMGNFTTEKDNFRKNYLERMSRQAEIAKKTIVQADSMYWKCDPSKHEEDKTFTQLTKVLQGFLVNEVDLNSELTCSENCPYYKLTKQYNCYQNNFCSKQPTCNGNVVGCQFVDSDMWVCQAPHYDKRRYDWIEYENGKVLGKKKSCNRPLVKVDSWWRYLFWHCSFCFCLCDDPKSSTTDRFFNMRPVVSDKAQNKVVTGIRFVKRNRIVHLQIQEGELLAKGGINESTVAWKPVDEYDIHDNGVEVGKDYHMITWESRAIDLDDLKVPDDSILTGLKFRRVGGHLNLEIEASQFNFEDGKLTHSGNKSEWISNDNTDGALFKPRTRLLLHEPDDPIRAGGPTFPDSKPDQFVEFDSTDMIQDAAQTTIPFIDTQDVAPVPSVPLVGLGVYHKGRKYSGGFIALRVFTYDFSKNILDHFPEINEAES